MSGNPFTLWLMDQYPVPNPLVLEADLERFLNEDLPKMGRGRLIRERSDLIDAMRYARRADVPRCVIPCDPTGRACGWITFEDWAHQRLMIVERLLDGIAAA